MKSDKSVKNSNKRRLIIKEDILNSTLAHV